MPSSAARHKMQPHCCTSECRTLFKHLDHPFFSTCPRFAAATPNSISLISWAKPIRTIYAPGSHNSLLIGYPNSNAAHGPNISPAVQDFAISIK
nr:hypothetical protein Iba_chr02cCG9110 [Ipomoea batatas]